MSHSPAERDRSAGQPEEMPVVTLFGKADCPLCDEARAALERVGADLPFQLLERDITEDDEVHRAYFERIPVIALDGEELFDYHVDESVLRARLRARAAGSGPGSSTRAMI